MPGAKQSPLLLYLIILLGMVLGYLYNSQSDPTLEVLPVPENFQLTTLKGLDNLRIDYSELQGSEFQSLRTFGELPVRAGQGGSSNPFQ